MDSDLFDEDHELFRASVRGFVDRHVVPNLQKWDADRLIDRETWRAAGKQGLLGLAAPKEFGGSDEQDYRFRVVIQQEIARVGEPRGGQVGGRINKHGRSRHDRQSLRCDSAPGGRAGQGWRLILEIGCARYVEAGSKKLVACPSGAVTPIIRASSWVAGLLMAMV
jgi:hypothetical protein